MKKALTILLLLVSASIFAQGPEVRLAIDHITGPRLLSEVGTTANASGKYVHLFGWARFKGWTDAEIMSLSVAEAEWHNAFWSGENGNYGSPAPGHAINITVPAGKFPVTYPLPFAQGVYKGAGSRFHDSNGTHSYGSTQWYVDHPAWKASKSVDRIILRSANWGVDGGYGAWVHHYVIQNMMFDGNRRTKWMPTAPGEHAGIGAWDSGEASTIANCYFDNFEKDGILLVRGTPVNIFACSMFNTNRFGIAIVGGGSVTVTSPSGDESGIGLIGSISGYGRPSNTRLAVFGAKQETSTSGEFRPWKGSSFLYAEGWITATIHGVSYASGWVNPYDFITWVRDPNVGNHSSITVSGTHFFGNSPRCLFYDQDRNAEYLFEGNAWQNAMQTWTWHEAQGLKTDWKTILPSMRTGAKGRLQHVGPDGATSWATAQIYDPTGGTVAPPPPTSTPCVYTTGAWSECVNGTQTRTVTSSPAGCTGTPPASSQACTVTPPPPTTVIASWTFRNHTPTTIPGMTLRSGSARVQSGTLRTTADHTYWSLDTKGVRSVTLTDFTPSTLNYQYILTTANGNGLIILPDGSLQDNVSGGDLQVLPPGTLKVGTSYTGTFQLPAVRDFTGFGASPGQGNAWQGSFGGLQLR
jgi:hypothetical protein